MKVVPSRLVLGLVLSTTLVWAIACDGGDERVVASPAPQELAGLRLQSVLTGEEAVRDMDRLHNRENGFGLLDGWVGYYENDATVWFGVAADEGAAAALIDDMASSIAGGDSPFTDPVEESVGELALYSVQGLGQIHFFYRSGVNVVWLAAPPGDEMSFFHEAIQSIN